MPYKAKLRGEGADIIDFGFGNPDLPTPKHVIDKLIETVQKPRTTGYSVSRGILGLRQACARYYQRRFDVELDPQDEIIATIGSKEGFANLAQAITAPGDVIYAPRSFLSTACLRVCDCRGEDTRHSRNYC